MTIFFIAITFIVGILISTTAIDRNTARVQTLPLMFGILLCLVSLSTGVLGGYIECPGLAAVLPSLWLMTTGVCLVLVSIYAFCNSSPFSRSIPQFAMFGVFKWDDFGSLLLIGLALIVTGFSSFSSSITAATEANSSQSAAQAVAQSKKPAQKTATTKKTRVHSTTKISQNTRKSKVQ